MVSNKIIYDKLIFYYDVDDMNITIYGKDWKPVEYLSDPERREKVRQHILKYDLTKRIGGKKYMTLLNENKVDINGFTNKFDVLTSLKENIEDDNKDTAIDIVNQLIEVETGTKEESDIDTMLELENEMSRGK
tara:strand:+ start:156 stop:554 length:399 start_codon:yes stop_codon:yes gene_type:complete